MPAITNTWKRRLASGGRGGGRVILIVLVLSASLNGIVLVWHAIFPPA
ncbi:MAG: hypothetical protein QOC62_2872, partial [Mycobacterium sp.]|nr:hypothetical protein [Mycobacterium sp.]